VFHYDFLFSSKYSKIALYGLKWKHIIYSREIIKVSTWVISWYSGCMTNNQFPRDIFLYPIRWVYSLPVESFLMAFKAIAHKKGHILVLYFACNTLPNSACLFDLVSGSKLTTIYCILRSVIPWKHESNIKIGPQCILESLGLVLFHSVGVCF